MTLGALTLQKAALMAIMETAPKGGDRSVKLAQEMIAARLNLAQGSWPSIAPGALTDGDALLAAHSGNLPFNIPPSSEEGAAMEQARVVLAEYNDGTHTPDCVSGPGHHPNPNEFHLAAVGTRKLKSPGAAGMSLVAFPNPAGEVLTLRLQLPESGAASIEIRGVDGDLVQTISVSARGGESQDYRLRVSGLSRGIYFAFVIQQGRFGEKVMASVKFAVAR